MNEDAPGIPGDDPADELAPVQAEWERQLDELTGQWERTVTPAQQAELTEQIAKAVDDGDLVQLAALTVGTTAAAGLLAPAMAAMGVTAGLSAAGYAASVGIVIGAVAWPDGVRERMDDVAGAVAGSLGRAYANVAGNEAIRRAVPGASGREVAEGVRTYLTTLKTGTLRAQLGGALTQAQQLGREAAMRSAEDDGHTARYFATEVLDRGTCVNCRAIDDTELPSLDAAMLAYGGGPYIGCLGLWRCRGTFVARWLDEDGDVRSAAREREDAASPMQFAWLGEMVNDDHWRVQPRDDKGRWTDHGAAALGELVDEVKALGAIGEGDHWSRLNGGAGEQGVWLATLPGGRKVVAKTHPSWADPDDTRTYVQADVLSSRMMSRLGVPSATVIADPDDDTTAWIQFVPGNVIGDGGDERAFFWSDEGARMGLADMLIANGDRNPGNIIVTPGGEHAGIDQSYAFGFFGMDGFVPGNLAPAPGSAAPTGRYAQRGEGLVDNPLTQADIMTARTVLDDMQADFATSGHGDWLAASHSMLDLLAVHATGTEDLL